MRRAFVTSLPGAALVATAVVALPGVAWAQAQAPAASLGDLAPRVKVGSTVFVTDASGLERQGKLTGLSASSLRLKAGRAELELPAADVLTVAARKPDSVKHGAWIGLAAGAALGVILGVDACNGDYEDEMCKGAIAGLGLLGGVMGAGIGAVVDRAIPGKKAVLYRREGAHAGPARLTVGLAPTVSPRRQGVAVAIGF
jgi:hypothetical protein